MFVRYEEKRWVPRGGNTKSPSRVSEEKASFHRPLPSSSGHRYTNNINRVPEVRNIAHPPNASKKFAALTHSSPATVKVFQQVRRISPIWSLKMIINIFISSGCCSYLIS